MIKSNGSWLAGGLVVLALTVPRGMVVGEELNRVIRYLLAHVKNSDVVFIRNNKEYTAHKAEDHMRRKYEHFKDRIHSAEDFIQYAGTKSLLTGRPYRVRLKNGVTMLSQKWLEGALDEYRKKNSG